MKNNLVNQDIKTDKPVPMSYEALKAERDAQQKRADALAVEKVEYFSDPSDMFAATLKFDGLEVTRCQQMN
ncbi:hypothetical protein ACUNGP_21755 [Serratia sp. IR-2025]